MIFSPLYGIIRSSLMLEIAKLYFILFVNVVIYYLIALKLLFAIRFLNAL